MASKKKCGLNFLPDWVFNDPVFLKCCVQHDTDYEELRGKFRSDYAFLVCNMETAALEQHRGWRTLQYIQGVLLFLLVVFLPVSYALYLQNFIKRSK